MEDFDKNTWIGGMDQDSSKSKFQSNKYYELRNAHVLTHEGLSTGSIENEKGTELSFTLPTIPSSTSLGAVNNTFSIQPNPRIIGWTFYRNDLIVISTCSDGTGHIWLIPFDITTGEPTATVSVDSHLRFVGALNLSVDYRIRKIIPNFEYGNDTDGGVYKIYFTDGYNNLRHLNFYDTDNFLFGTKIVDIPPSLLEITPELYSNAILQNTLPIVYSKTLSGGQYKAGVVQYAYQLYNTYGANTRYIGHSKLIHLTASNDYENTSVNYKGSAEDTFTGKAVEINIPSVDTLLFGSMRVVSLFYKTNTSTPDINIIYDGQTSTTGFKIIDNGASSIGTLTLLEFTSLGNQLFSASDLEVKNNRLIAANIKTQNRFEVDNFDTRIYRFNSSRNALLYTSETFSEYITIDGTSPDWGIVPDDHNCINEFNHIVQGWDSLTAKEFMYQTNGTTLGGEGENIKFEFITKDIVIDAGNEGTTLATIRKLQSPTDTINNSYTSYASPYIDANFRGYCRDEIYAFAITWIDEYGNESFDYWMCDIKFPRIYDGANYITAYRGIDSKNYTKILGVKFTLKNIPSGVKGYKITRCERTQSDRTVLFQGLVGKTNVRETLINPETLTTFTNNASYPDSVLNYLSTNYGDLITIDSPEISFYKDNYTYQNGDFLSFPAVYDTMKYIQNIKYDVVKEDWYFKLTNVSIYTSYGGVTPKQNTILVSDGVILEGQDVTSIPTQIGTSKYVNYLVFPGSGLAGTAKAFKNTTGIFKMASNIPYSITALKYYLANYKRPIIPYKGNTYQARLQREYISCSNVIDINTLSVDVYNGDTYIQFFNYLRGVVDQRLSIYNNDRTQQWIAFPVETRINLELRTDELLKWLKRLDNITAKVDPFIPSTSGVTALRIVPNQPIVTYRKKLGPFNEEGEIEVPIELGSTVKLGNHLYKVIETSKGNFTVDKNISSVDYPAAYTDVLFNEVDSGNNNVFKVGKYRGSSVWFLRDKKEEGLKDYPESYPSDVTDLYLYNSVYSRENNIIKNFPKPFNFKNITEFGNKIQASDKKIVGSIEDQWLNFRVDSYNNVDSIYGNINALKVFKDNLFFFQDSGFGVVPIDERVTVPDESGNKMILGDGNIVGRYGYISRITGCSNQPSIVTTEDQLHFFDIRLKRWNVYTGGDPLPLNVIGGMNSYFNSKIEDYYTQLKNDKLVANYPTGIHGIYDIRNNRILMSFIAEESLDSDENYADTLSFNLLQKSFEQFIDIFPSMYCNIGNTLLSVNSIIQRGTSYKHNTGTYGMYYNNTIPANVILKFISNKYPDNTKIYSYVEFNSTIEKDGLEYFDTLNNQEIIDIFRMLNDYQTTGFKKLRVMAAPNSTNVIPSTDIEVRRRFRTWRFKVPRSLQMKDGDRSDARIRSQYAFLEFIFKNNDNKRLILHDVSTFFMKS